jgi:hypothetical protein
VLMCLGSKVFDRSIGVEGGVFAGEGLPLQLSLDDGSCFLG